MSTSETVTGLAKEHARAICYRCGCRDHVWPPDNQHRVWTHGTDMHGTVTVGPEICDAHEIHKLMAKCFGDYYNPNEDCGGKESEA